MIILLRAIILYLLIVFSLRLMGKRQLGELQPSELVITILISNIAATPIENRTIPMSTGIIPILVLVAFELIVSNISLHSKKFRKLISGKPVVIIKDGKIDIKAMKQLRFSIDDLMESLRGNGIFDVNEVSYAVVETTGSVSVYQKFPYRPATAETLKIKGESTFPPQIVISDGAVMTDALITLNLTEKWLFSILKTEKLESKDIFIMTADRQKNYKIFKKE